MSLLAALVGGAATAWLSVLARRDRRWYWRVAGVAVVAATTVVIEQTKGSVRTASVLVYLALVGVGMLINPKRRSPSSGVGPDDT